MRIWKRLLGTALCLCAAVCLMSVSASAAEHSNHPVCGETHKDIGDHTGPCSAVEWIEVTQKDVTDNNGLTLKAGNNYYLGENIKVKWEITIKGTVNLCLNGHSIERTYATTNTSFTNAVRLQGRRHDHPHKRYTRTRRDSQRRLHHVRRQNQRQSCRY